MKKNLVAIAVAQTLLLPVFAHADTGAAPSLTFSGFGTAGVVSTNTDKAEFATSVLQPNGAKKGADFGVDSLLGGQVNYRMSETISFTGQVVANKNADDKFTPHAEWAFAKYAITPDLGVRGGIMAVPLFMISDSRLVGFANPWVRPPIAVYSQAPLTNFRGVDLLYRHSLGTVNLTIQPYFGNAPTKVPETAGGHTTADINKMAGLNFSAEMGAWTARAGYMRAKFDYHSATIDTLFAGLRSINPLVPGAAALANSLAADDKSLNFTTLGLGYEGGNVYFQAEYARRKTEFFLADTSAWYTTLGYRRGDWLPYVTLSQVKVDSATSSSAIPAVGPLAALSAGLNSILSSQNYAQKSVAIGARWQFAKNADVKLEVERIRLPNGALGTFKLAQPGFAGSSVNVYSATIDFVF
jgi:hypothetical protein